MSMADDINRIEAINKRSDEWAKSLRELTDQCIRYRSLLETIRYMQSDSDNRLHISKTIESFGAIADSIDSGIDLHVQAMHDLAQSVKDAMDELSS